MFPTVRVPVILAAIMAIFSTQAVHTLGTGILFSILATANVLNIVFITLTMIYGQRLREAYAAKVHSQQDDGPKEGRDASTADNESKAADMEHVLVKTASKHSIV